MAGPSFEGEAGHQEQCGDFVVGATKLKRRRSNKGESRPERQLRVPIRHCARWEEGRIGRFVRAAL